MFSPLPGIGFLQNKLLFFRRTKKFLSNNFYEHGYKIRENYRDDVEILIEREENENTRKNKNYAEHSSANMKQVVSLKMDHSTKSQNLPSTSSTALFHGIYITGGTFNVHVAANSSTESNTTVSQSPKSKDFVGFVL